MQYDDTDQQLRDLIDRRDIYDLLVRLSSAIDRNDRGLMLECYFPGAVDDHGEFTGPVEQFVDWIGKLYRERVHAMAHHITNHRLERRGDQAAAETYVIVFLTGRPVDGRQVQMIGVGRYLDRLEKRDKAWRIAQRTALIDWQQVQSFPVEAEDPLVTRVTWGAASRKDPSYAHFASERQG
jgi:hypothetical protein